jgi:hypothetical protein
MRRYVSLVLCTALFLGPQAVPADGLTLTGGKIAKFVDEDGTGEDKAIIKFARDPVIQQPLPIPACPNESSIRLLSERHDIGVVPLGCNSWRPAAGGFKYVDKEGLFGGVQKIFIKPTPKGGTLLLKLKGENYGFNAVNGPIDYIEARLTIGATHYCGRFQVPPSAQRKNDASGVIFKGPSSACLPPD